jgi:hypothetical protein
VVPPIITGLGRLRQEDSKCEASLDYTARPCLKKSKKKIKEKKIRGKNLPLVYFCSPDPMKL